MEVERNWTRTRYTFICEDETDKEFLDKMNKYIDKLEEENERLKSLEPGWGDFLILFLPVLFGGLIGSFLGVLIYNLL